MISTVDWGLKANDLSIYLYILLYADIPIIRCYSRCMIVFMLHNMFLFYDDVCTVLCWFSCSILMFRLPMLTFRPFYADVAVVCWCRLFYALMFRLFCVDVPVLCWPFTSVLMSCFLLMFILLYADVQAVLCWCVDCSMLILLFGLDIFYSFYQNHSVPNRKIWLSTSIILIDDTPIGKKSTGRHFGDGRKATSTTTTVLCWCSCSTLMFLFCSGEAVQHLGCFKYKSTKREYQTELIGGELLELRKDMTVDHCLNRCEHPEAVLV